MRIDKYLAQLGVIPRRQTKKLLKAGAVLLNNEIVDSPQTKIKEGDILQVYEELIPVQFAVHLLIHKPAGYISSNIDEGPHHSYKDLLSDCPYSELVEIAGRLDVDTEGLLLCSSDGKVIHNIIHPEKKIEKQYYVETTLPITNQMIKKLASGVMLEDFSQARPAKVEKLSDTSLNLIITEGKFHQVKRMLIGVSNEVSYLRRDRIGEWVLGDLEKGKWKYIEII